MVKVNLDYVEIGRNHNHLIFYGYVPERDDFHKYSFDFTGVDVISTYSLTRKQAESLRKELVKDYGYAPYDIEKAKEVLGAWKQYEIEL